MPVAVNTSFVSNRYTFSSLRSFPVPVLPVLPLLLLPTAIEEMQGQALMFSRQHQCGCHCP